MKPLVVLSEREGSSRENRILDRAVASAGLLRGDVEVVLARDMPNTHGRFVVACGDEASRYASGLMGSVADTWHGSLVCRSAHLGVERYREWITPRPDPVMITYDMSKLAVQFDWHPMAFRDWARVGQIVRGEYAWPVMPKLVINDVRAFERWVDTLPVEAIVSLDTELTPDWIIGLGDAREVHVLLWTTAIQRLCKLVLQRKDVTKIAHNLQHDLAMCELRFGFRVSTPYFDTMGGARAINTKLERSLSPGMTSRFTNWPNHKWLVQHDAMVYNGLDVQVALDTYHEQTRLLTPAQRDVLTYDHRLLKVLYAMSIKGVRVDEAKRGPVEALMQASVDVRREEVIALAEPIIDKRLTKFNKPTLFTETISCVCCGGGSKSRGACWRCGGLLAKPKNKNDYRPLVPRASDAEFKKLKLRDFSFPVCTSCQGAGRITQRIAFNPDSPAQLADVLYRGFRIPARRYKGTETTRSDSLAPLAEKWPVVQTFVEYSEAMAELDTVKRLQPSTDSRLHCVFDPWGTGSGRIAGREGLLLPGTNLMNLPKPARAFIVPDPGKTFLYPDMAQIEARAVAVLTNDEGFKQAFGTPLIPSNEKEKLWPEWRGKIGRADSHLYLAAMIYDKTNMVLTREQMKRLTYAAMYGVSPDQLGVELTNHSVRQGGRSVTGAEAASMLEAFFSTITGVRTWHRDIERELITTRTLVSPSGRERHWPSRIMEMDGVHVLAKVRKEGWSFKPQEMAARVLGEGLIELEDQHGGWIEPLVHVHDAVLCQVPTDRLEEGRDTVVRVLTRTMWGMEFPAECGRKGSNWKEAS